jgi:hypothetical protein
MKLQTSKLVIRTPQKPPLPWWEGMKGRGDQKVFILSTPTLTLPHQKGEGNWRGNLKYFWLEFWVCFEV